MKKITSYTLPTPMKTSMGKLVKVNREQKIEKKTGRKPVLRDVVQPRILLNKKNHNQQNYSLFILYMPLSVLIFYYVIFFSNYNNNNN